jgi:hypothetical protein
MTQSIITINFSAPSGTDELVTKAESRIRLAVGRNCIAHPHTYYDVHGHTRVQVPLELYVDPDVRCFIAFEGHICSDTALMGTCKEVVRRAASEVFSPNTVGVHCVAGKSMWT